MSRSLGGTGADGIQIAPNFTGLALWGRQRHSPPVQANLEEPVIRLLLRRDPLERVALLLVLALAVLVAGWALTHWAGITFPWKKLLDALGVVGTCAAVIVALWTTGATLRRQRDEQLVQARLVAAYLVPGLEDALEKLRFVVERAHFDLVPTETTTPAEVDAAFMDKLLEFAEVVTAETDFNIDVERLLLLAPLPNDCAGRVSSACGVVRVVRDELEDFDPGVFWTTHRDAGRQSAFERWHRMLTRAQELIEVALVDCKRAAAAIAPHPTGEELHGGG